MLRARKKNRVVRIPDEKMNEYKKLGYTITDEDGNTVYQPEDKDATIAALRKENQQLRQQLAEKDLLLGQKQAGKAEKPPEAPAQQPEESAGEEQTPAVDDGKAEGKAKGKGTAAKSK